MAYTKPQAQIHQEATIVPTELIDPLRPLIIAGCADLHRHSDADEKLLIAVGEYNPDEDTCYEWPGRVAGSVVDQAYAKVFVDNALLLYFSDPVGTGSTITPVSGKANRIISDSIKWKTNGDYARSAVLYDRDAKIGDAAILRSVYDPTGACEEITLTTEIAGFAAAEIDGTVDAAVMDSDNGETQSASAVIEQISGEENCVVTQAIDASAYDGLASGDITEEYTITVVQSSISGCSAARLRVVSASGNDDQAEVTPADFGEPTDIGTRGLTVTFSNTGTDSCESEASVAGVASGDFVFGQTWRATISQEFEAVNALAAGDYDGVKDDTYIIEVTKGGLWADLPEITVTTAKGLDYSGPTAVTGDQVEVVVGTHGVTVSFFGSGGGDADLSIGADAVVGLRKGDKFSIAVTAPTTGAVYTLLLKHDLPTRMRSATDIDVQLFIKSDISLPKNRESDAPNTNWYTEATQLCVQEGALAYDASWTDDGVQLPLPLKGGALYLEYREWLQSVVNVLGTANVPADLDDIPGPLDPDNPLKYGVSYALSASNGNGVRYLGVGDPDDLDSWQTALVTFDGDDTFYNFAPMTFDKEVQDLVLAQANNESGPTTNNWKACFFAIQGVTSVVRVSAATSSDEEEVLATLIDNPDATNTQYTLLQVPAGNGKFITNAVVPGDIVRYLYATDGFGVVTWTNFVVDSVLSEDSLLLYRAHTSAINSAQKIEIHHTLNKTEQAAAVAAKAAGFGDPRVCACWPDEFGNGGRTLPGYYLAALAAGYVGSVAPNQGLTNAQIGNVEDLSKSFGYFNNTQLNKMAESGVWIFATDKDGAHYIRHALTTDNTSLPRYEEMMRRNFDAISYFFYNRVKQYTGKVNVQPKFLSKLEWELKDAISFLKQSTNDDLGGQLIDGIVVYVRQHPTQKDHIEAYLRLLLPAPANVIEIHLVI